MAKDTLKAYYCTTDDGESAEIRFGRTNGGVAFPYSRSEGAHVSEVTVRRAKQFDAYAPGPVPISALLEDGWHFECSCCYRRISLSEDFVEDHGTQALREHAAREAPRIAALARFDAENPRPADPEAGMKPAERWAAEQLVNGWRHRRHAHSAYILPPMLSRVALRIHDDTNDVYCDARCEQKAFADRAAVDFSHDEAEREAEKRWPGCAPYESNRWPYLTPSVSFHAPGMEYPATWRPGDEPFMATTDVDAWNTYLATITEATDGQAAAA
jgi:hypothetical protein